MISCDEYCVKHNTKNFGLMLKHKVTVCNSTHMLTQHTAKLHFKTTYHTAKQLAVAASLWEMHVYFSVQVKAFV